MSLALPHTEDVWIPFLKIEATRALENICTPGLRAGLTEQAIMDK
jgi:hypothetical protein